MGRSYTFRKRAVIAVMTTAAVCAVHIPSSFAQARQAEAQAISRADRQTGANAHPQLLREFGGAMSGPQATYVESVGKNVAVQSGLSNARGDFTVTLLNSPVNNAFAIPGGYIYVTRQLVGLMNNEAELAAVLGHEVGHVAARHSAKRQSAATRNQVLGALGSILSGALLGDGALGQLGQKVATQGTQMLTLQYSRSQETAADNLGIEYLRRAGYDPRSMATVLQSLANQNALDARLQGSTKSLPAWASTHPDPASRVRAAAGRAGANASGQLNRDSFLSQVDGLTYGDDPQQGIVDGQRFTHPELKLAFEAPNGFALVNSTNAVSVSGQSGKAEFTAASYDGSLERYIGNVFTSLNGNQQRVAPNVQRTTINGIPAAYATMQAQNQSGALDVSVFAYEFGSAQAYHFVAITPAGGSQVFRPMFNSMRRITSAQASQVRPRKLRVVTVRAGDTVQSLATRMAYDNAQLERFLVLNGINASTRLAAGQRVKVVTY